MIDVDQFTPIQGLGIPDLPLYLVADPTRGDELPNTSPNEALTTLRAAGRTPLTLNEGISWLLQDPTMLTPGACFMTIGSRKHTASGHLDVEADRVVLSATAVPSVRQAQVEELTDVVESARFVGPE